MSQRPSRSASFSTVSSARSANAGTQRSVTAVITPYAPSPTAAAASSSGSAPESAWTTEPSASTSSRPVTWVASPPYASPVPWVPVEIAPATVCTSTSPRFSSASPCAASSPDSACSRVPARTVTLSPVIATTPVSRSGRSSRPSVSAAPVNECPAPAIRTRSPSLAASLTAAATSSADAGASTCAGRDTWSPAQFRHSTATPGPYRAA